MNDQDSAYIIHVCTGDEECFQVFAENKFQMMAVLKKVLTSENLVTSVEAVGNTMPAVEFLDCPEDLNFGNDSFCQGD